MKKLPGRHFFASEANIQSYQKIRLSLELNEIQFGLIADADECDLNQHLLRKA